MARCFDLARRAGKKTKSNPMVGSLIVLNNEIISEGYHRGFGQKHAERDAIDRLDPKYQDKISQMSIYITLEPCNVFGKTPPCLDYILEKGFKKVFVSALDPSPHLQGKSIDKMRSEGIQVTTNVLESEGNWLIQKFIANQQKRPYIILKFAQSKDGFIGQKGKQVWLSNAYSKVKAHQWRDEVDGILVGKSTVLSDNPQLTNRLAPGDSPIRIIIDRKLETPPHFHVRSDEHPSIFITEKILEGNQKSNIHISDHDNFLPTLLKELYQRDIFSVLIEGGAFTINQFIKQNLWDEARVIQTQKTIQHGIPAPTVIGKLIKKESLDSDEIVYFKNDTVNLS